MKTFKERTRIYDVDLAGQEKALLYEYISVKEGKVSVKGNGDSSILLAVLKEFTRTVELALKNSEEGQCSFSFEIEPIK